VRRRGIFAAWGVVGHGLNLGTQASKLFLNRPELCLLLDYHLIQGIDQPLLVGEFFFQYLQTKNDVVRHGTYLFFSPKLIFLVFMTTFKE